MHGLASPLGAYFPIPHGVVCGTLVAEATAVNIGALSARAPESPALAKYHRVAELLHRRHFADRGDALDALVALLRAWVDRLDLPRLSAFGMQEADVEHVVANCRGGSMKGNPIVLTDAEVAGLVRARL